MPYALSLRFASICSGCGGLDLGLEQAGLECALQVEIDPAARCILEHRWPAVPKLRNLLEVTPADVPAVDLFAGGTPCQDLSVAGRRAGLDGERSGLFFRFVALADSQPAAWVLWENVPGAMSSPKGSPGSDFAAVIRELTGFEPAVPVDGWRSGGFAVGPKRWCVWRVLDSQYFGVAQQRPRLFVVAGPRDRCAPEVLLEPGCLPGDSAPRRVEREDLAGSLTVGSSPGGGWRIGADEAAANQVVVTPHRLAQITSAENRANPKPGSPAPSLNGDARLAVAFRCHQIAHALTASHDASEDGSGRGLPLVCAEVAQTLTASMNNGGFATAGANPGMSNPIIAPAGVRRLTPRECERLQGFPDDWTRFGPDGRELTDSPRYRAVGNAVTVSVAQWIGERIVAAHSPEVAS